MKLQTEEFIDNYVNSYLRTQKEARGLKFFVGQGHAGKRAKIIVNTIHCIDFAIIILWGQ